MRRPAQAAALGAASASRFSPKSVRPSPLSSITSTAGCVLVIAIRVTSPLSRPALAQAASILPLTSARLPASSARRESGGCGGFSSLEEVGDIQVVVLFEDHRAAATRAHVEDLLSRTGTPGVP